MKAKILPVLWLGLLLPAGGAFCADATGDRLIIGTNTATSSSYFLSGGVIGVGNNAWGVDKSLVIGSDNIGSNVQNSLIVGEGIEAEPMITTLASGTGHWMFGEADNLVTGSFHILSGTSNLVGGAFCQVAGGTANLVFGENSLANGSYGVVLGKGLILTTGGSTTAKTILGQYNKPIGDPLFVVANGTSAATGDRKNALEITQDGSVRIPKKQGDVGMGRFGYTADQ